MGISPKDSKSQWYVIHIIKDKYQFLSLFVRNIIVENKFLTFVSICLHFMVSDSSMFLLAVMLLLQNLNLVLFTY
jgi:hypothetical protein